MSLIPLNAELTIYSQSQSARPDAVELREFFETEPDG